MTSIKSFHIQTRGYSQENDYQWVKIQNSDKRKTEVPPFLDFFKDFRIQDIIEFQRPSIILARDGKYFFLLVTALETEPDRVDFMNRQIRNSVAWTFEGDEDGKNEQIIRAITILALKRELGDLVSKSITNNDGHDYGFQVFFDELESIGTHFNHLGNSDPNPQKWISGDSEDVREQLCSELSKNRFPEEDDSLLILVTTLKSKESLQSLSAWRGISSRSSASIEWLDSNSVQLYFSQKKTTLKKPIPIIAVFTLILLGLLVVLGIYLKPTLLKPSKNLPVQQEETKQIQILKPQSQSQIPTSI